MDLLDLKDLDLVANLHIVEIRDTDAAFGPIRNALHFVDKRMLTIASSSWC